jgi:2-(1,2-epoxy-1,2-dihydrophenyl)acetyl-CoA isomerase
MKDYPTPPDGLVVESDAGTGVLRLRLDRPDRRNAITDDMVMALIETIEAAGSDESVRVIALTGTGEHFCSGFDLGLRGKGPEKPRLGATQRQMRWHVNRLIPTMLETQTPIVTAATGYVIGLGLNLALASDFAVVAEDARLRAPFTGLGFTPDSGASWLIPRLVGVARAKELLMLGREITGVEAADWGLVHRAAPAKAVPAVADELVAELAASATVAVGLTKLLVQRSLTVDLERHLADEALAIELSSRSADFREASDARRDRRAPDFDGR